MSHTQATLDGSLGGRGRDLGSSESSFLWTRPYILPKLLGTYIPEKLIGLEQQLKTVKLHILGTARHRISSTLLIRGLRGSGKTQLIGIAISQAMRELDNDPTNNTPSPHIIQADAISVDPLQFCSRVCSVLDESFDPKKRIARHLLLEKAMELLVNGGPIVLVIENIDNYLASGSFLYKLFDLCHSETRTICAIYTTRIYKFVSSLPMRVQSRFTYELVDTMQNLSIAPIPTGQNPKELAHKASIGFLRQFILDRLTVSVSNNHSLSTESSEPTLKKVVDKQSLISIESPKLSEMMAWNNALEEVLKSPEIEDTLSWIASLIRDCYLYLQLASAIYLGFMRSPKRPSVDVFNHAAVLYIQSSQVDQQMQALECLSNEACYLLGAIVDYCRCQNSPMFTLSNVINAFSSGKGAHLSTQMYQLMQASMFELIDGKIIIKRQSSWRLVVPMLKILEFSKRLPESIRILF
ncbi:Orc4 [Giardia lamblia P15]|uniref:Orc4 n=1 Tax=Giardia intestinalis (strain P15) TaxID=658858 RepID=E1F553_GIAIA|nr:Orc4 [Giardia lamblia P15]